MSFMFPDLPFCPVLLNPETFHYELRNCSGWYCSSPLILIGCQLVIARFRSPAYHVVNKILLLKVFSNYCNVQHVQRLCVNDNIDILRISKLFPQYCYFLKCLFYKKKSNSTLHSIFMNLLIKLKFNIQLVLSNINFIKKIILHLVNSVLINQQPMEIHSSMLLYS